MEEAESSVLQFVEELTSPKDNQNKKKVCLQHIYVCSSVRTTRTCSSSSRPCVQLACPLVSGCFGLKGQVVVTRCC